MAVRPVGQTPSQTIGPFFSIRLSGEGQNVLCDVETQGERIRIEGRVLDGDRAPIEDALIELWQANAAGRYRHPADDRDAIAVETGFTGFGRAASGVDTGAFWFETVKPGAVPGPDEALQAPHVSLIVQARGMLLPSFTRVYFSDEPDANAHDPVLSQVPRGRRATLIAERAPGSDPAVPAVSAVSAVSAVYRYDIVFQGDHETVFFDF
ncbi:protocatechuate 3,4-dioxygenase subunit alpha [soil metagenome]